MCNHCSEMLLANCWHAQPKSSHSCLTSVPLGEAHRASGGHVHPLDPAQCWEHGGSLQVAAPTEWQRAWGERERAASRVTNSRLE